MTEAEYRRKLTEVDRLLNDPEHWLDPNQVWSLLADIAAYAACSGAAAAIPGLLSCFIRE